MTAKPFWKAGAGFAAAFISALYLATKDRTDLGTLKTSDWLAIVVGALLTAGLTFFVPYQSTNTPPAG